MWDQQGKRAICISCLTAYNKKEKNSIRKSKSGVNQKHYGNMSNNINRFNRKKVEIKFCIFTFSAFFFQFQGRFSLDWLD